MRITQLTPDLIQLTRMRFVNAYLVREEDGFTLVDTTLGGVPEQLITAAEDAGGQIRRIALTHAHGDHIGSLDGLRDKLGSSVEVLLGEPDARILAGEKVVEGKLPGSWPKVKTIPDVRLLGGERIGSLEAVPSPGHTPGHMAFFDTRDGTLIAGDVFTAIGRVSVSNHFYVRFPLAQMATWNKQTDLASARTLRALDPSRLLVGHGPATPLPGEAMSEAIARSAAALGEPAGDA
jgi:glyoxylase-like metal-dependent hydrolase (beta-lactamase superfamily II)